MRVSRLALIIILLAVSPAISMIPIPPKFKTDPPMTIDLLGCVNTHADEWAVKDAAEDVTVWNSFHYSDTDKIAMAFGEPVMLTADVKNQGLIEEACLRFAKDNERLLGVEGCSPVLISIKRLPNLTAVTIGFEVRGVRVFDSYVTMGLNDRGEMFTIKARGYGGDVVGSFSLSEDQAAHIASSQLEDKNTLEKIERILYPQRNGKDDLKLNCAYRIELDSPNPALKPVFYIDGENGEVLASENQVYFLDQEGTTYGLYYPLYGTQDYDAGIFPYEWVEIVAQDSGFSDIDGNFVIEVDPDEEFLEVNSLLRGLYAEVHEFIDDDAAYSIGIEPGDELEIAWDDQSSSSDERNLYYHVNFIHDFWVNLDESFDDLDFPLTSVCGVGGEGYEDLEDNAFSSPFGIYFGRGNRFDNFALYADVIYHEYGHSVTGEIYRMHNLPYQGEPGALNEAWSDYFPCSITDEPLMGEGGLVGNNRHLRNLNNNLVYPDDITDEVHADSRIISAAMWHSREVIGRAVADSLFHFARYLHGNEFRGYFLDVLATDDDDGDLTNGSPHYQVLYNQFTRHGITVGEMPHFTISRVVINDDEQNGASGNDNGIWEPGETIRVNLSVFRVAAPYPYEDEPVHVLIETEYGQIEMERGEFDTDGIEVGEFIEIPETLLLHIQDDAPVGFADLLITVSAESDTMPGHYSMRVPIGQPQVLLVKDGCNPYDHTKYFQAALDSIGMVWADYRTYDPVRSIADFLPLFSKVVWFTGNANRQVLTEESIMALEDYLDNGGKVLITGQCAVEAPGTEEFYRRYFGAENVADSLHEYYVQGVADDPVSRGYSILLVGGDGARNQVRPSAVRGVGEGIEIYHWAQADDVPAAGVRTENYRTGARTVLLSFGLEGAGGAGITNSMPEVLQAIIEWFDSPAEVKDGIAAPLEFNLGLPYPNPFNGRISIPITLSRESLLDLSIYDVSGSLVWSGRREIGSGASTWSIDARSWGSGIYFINAHSSGNARQLRIALVK